MQALAEEVADQWLARYGVVARDWWRRERPAVPWRAIYEVLKRMEYRGEVRRGYFVRGLAGAQFARPEAVEALREAAAVTESPASMPIVVLAASDPANPYALPLTPGVEPDPIGRPRARGALLVMRAGVVLLSAEGRGRAVRVRPGLDAGVIAEAARALAEHLVRTAMSARGRDLIVERIDGEDAAWSAHAQAFVDAGWRRATRVLRWLG